MIAEKVESAEAFKEAKAAGFSLFQGYYFCRPITCKATALPQRKLAYMQLLAALRQPNVGVREIEEIVKHDVSLSYRVLRCVNSAAFGLRSEVTSIRQALVMIGIAPDPEVGVGVVDCRPHVGRHVRAGHRVAAARALLRAARREAGRPRGRLRDVPARPVLAARRHPRPAARRGDCRSAAAGRRASAALLGDDNVPRQILDVVIAYENGQWDEALEKAQALGLTEDSPATVYSDALKWARELSRAAA